MSLQHTDPQEVNLTKENQQSFISPKIEMEEISNISSPKVSTLILISRIFPVVEGKMTGPRIALSASSLSVSALQLVPSLIFPNTEIEDISKISSWKVMMLTVMFEMLLGIVGRSTGPRRAGSSI